MAVRTKRATQTPLPLFAITVLILIVIAFCAFIFFWHASQPDESQPPPHQFTNAEKEVALRALGDLSSATSTQQHSTSTAPIDGARKLEMLQKLSEVH